MDDCLVLYYKELLVFVFNTNLLISIVQMFIFTHLLCYT